MEEKKKKFSLMSAILSVICVVFVAEAAAPVAAIGNSQFLVDLPTDRVPFTLWFDFFRIRDYVYW